MSKALVWAVLLGACAHGGTSEPTDAPISSHNEDAPSNINVDAPVSRMDASTVIPDAFVPQDAATPIDSAIFCSSNSQCTNAGECCLIISQPPGLCTPGTIIGGVCLPIT